MGIRQSPATIQPNLCEKLKAESSSNMPKSRPLLSVISAPIFSKVASCRSHVESASMCNKVTEVVLIAKAMQFGKSYINNVR